MEKELIDILIEIEEYMSESNEILREHRNNELHKHSISKIESERTGISRYETQDEYNKAAAMVSLGNKSDREMLLKVRKIIEKHNK